ncbi:MAG TPA: polysaccharide deacetylase family protein [bacterium]|nr:polysaccharide deacetylase family protein [bacterium]
MNARPDRPTAARRVLGLFHRWSPAAAEWALGTIIRVSTQDPVLALTFDDGPHPSSTPRVLEILRAHRARATFFMLGQAAARYPALVRQVADAGHAIGNHSWDHPSFPEVPRRERRRQIGACGRAIAPYGERLFRPPYGDQDDASRLDALWMRHEVVAWDVDAGDWRGDAPAVVAYRVIARVRPGSIVLFHDGSEAALRGDAVDPSSMLKALDLVFNRLRDTLTSVTVPDLLRRGRPRRVLWRQRNRLALGGG